MPLRLSDRTATLVGIVSVDETEQLATWLRSAVRPRVNLRGCTHLHTSALQVLLVAAPQVSSEPQDPFLRQHVLPLLLAAGDRQSAEAAAPGADPRAADPQTADALADDSVSDVAASDALDDEGADEAALVGTDAG